MKVLKVLFNRLFKHIFSAACLKHLLKYLPDLVLVLFLRLKTLFFPSPTLQNAVAHPFSDTIQNKLELYLATNSV